MRSKNRFDFQAWNQELDTGARSDALLELAAVIREVVPEYAGPTKDFRARLQAQLLGLYDQASTRRVNISRRVFIWGLALFVVLVVASVGLWLSPINQPDVNAAEILELAGEHLSERLADHDIVYDRWILDWHQGGFQEAGIVAELWRTADGSQMRYQMFDNQGKLLYFDQRDHEMIWRSSYVRVVEGTEVGFVYQATHMPETNELEDQQQLVQLLIRDFANFWVYIDQMAGNERSDCVQLFCVLSALGKGWICDEQLCIINLGPVLGGDDFVIEAQSGSNDWLPNGREVYQVHLHLAGAPENYYQVLKFDTQTYDLLEIEDYSRGKLRFRIRLANRGTLSSSELSGDFFNSIPDGIEVRQWPSDYPLGHREDDRVWIISANPPPDSNISGVVVVELEIGYRLASLEQAAIHVGPLFWAGHDTGIPLEADKVPVKAGEDSIRVSFSFDSDQLGDGEWAIHPCFVDLMGITPNTCWSGAGTPSGIYLKWCVGCTQASPEP